jgi:hypothetical protein
MPRCTYTFLLSLCGTREISGVIDQSVSEALDAIDYHGERAIFARHICACAPDLGGYLGTQGLTQITFPEAQTVFSMPLALLNMFHTSYVHTEHGHYTDIERSQFRSYGWAWWATFMRIDTDHTLHGYIHDDTFTGTVRRCVEMRVSNTFSYASAARISIARAGGTYVHVTGAYPFRAAWQHAASVLGCECTFSDEDVGIGYPLEVTVEGVCKVVVDMRNATSVIEYNHPCPNSSVFNDRVVNALKHTPSARVARRIRDELAMLYTRPRAHVLRIPVTPELNDSTTVPSAALPYECTICFEDNINPESAAYILTCKHVFHADCIACWFASRESHELWTCPKCRAITNTDAVPLLCEDDDDSSVVLASIRETRFSLKSEFATSPAWCRGVVWIVSPWSWIPRGVQERAPMHTTVHSPGTLIHGLWVAVCTYPGDERRVLCVDTVTSNTVLMSARAAMQHEVGSAHTVRVERHTFDEVWLFQPPMAEN